ncbi:MAG: NUDIX hydrolase [Methanobacteriaceae archaeon]|jgi:8-oxo-dGTP diphosphatase|nr:NUDIX hydrolase [Methanobacteriaceae archaeon]
MNVYKKPSITVDIIIFNEDKEFILIKRKNDPYKDYWAIPGGFIDYGETVENAAIREAKEETNIDIKLKNILGVYSEKNRDPRGHTVTIVFLANGNIEKMKANSDAKEINIFSFNDIKNMKLAFDHTKILNDAYRNYLN